MADLLYYTKKLAEKIRVYDAVIDFAEDTHCFNPFYKQRDFTVIWTEIPNDEEFYY